MLSRLVSSVLAVSLLAAPAAARTFAAPPPGAPVPDSRIEPIRRPPEAVVDRAAVRRALAANRAKAIKLFRGYYKRGVYPRNTFTDADLNIWLDEDGRLCAAATIIAGWSAGHRALVMEQAEADNFIRLVDVTDGWLMDWMLTSGLTQEELVTIQLPFPPDHGNVIDDLPREIPDPRIALRNARQLRAKYVRIDRMLGKQRDASLELAVDRLIARPELARQVLAAAG
jgi:hypothetical protein